MHGKGRRPRCACSCSVRRWTRPAPDGCDQRRYVRVRGNRARTVGVAVLPASGRASWYPSSIRFGSQDLTAVRSSPRWREPIRRSRWRLPGGGGSFRARGGCKREAGGGCDGAGEGNGRAFASQEGHAGRCLSHSGTRPLSPASTPLPPYEHARQRNGGYRTLRRQHRSGKAGSLRATRIALQICPE